MELLAELDWIEAVGWLASVLTVASYSVSTMLPLRFLAITSSICFATYSFALGLWPLLAMELILLPINIYRFSEVLHLRGKLSKTARSTDADFSVIKRYGQKLSFAKGSKVFEFGDAVDQLYFIADGEIRIEENGVDLKTGDIFGEIAFFTDDATRTATATCLADATVYAVDEKTFMRLQFEDPSFGLSILRTLTRRLVDNVNTARVSLA